MRSALTIRLDDELEHELEKASERSGLCRSDIVREALRRELRLMEFSALRNELTPYAERQGWLTDEDVFRSVS